VQTTFRSAFLFNQGQRAFDQVQADICFHVIRLETMALNAVLSKFCATIIKRASQVREITPPTAIWTGTNDNALHTHSHVTMISLCNGNGISSSLDLRDVLQSLHGRVARGLTCNVKLKTLFLLHTEPGVRPCRNPSWLAAIQKEIQRHDFSYFVDEPPSMAEGGRGVVVAGCPAYVWSISAFQIGRVFSHS